MSTERTERWPGGADTAEAGDFTVNVYADSAILEAPVDPYSCCCGGCDSQTIMSTGEIRVLIEALLWALTRLASRAPRCIHGFHKDCPACKIQADIDRRAAL